MKEKKNFMDFIPCRNPQNIWDMDEAGIVTVHVKNKGFYNFLAQKLFGRPRVSHIRLDMYGSFIWQQLDGRKTVFDISGLVQKEFGQEAEPLLERLAEYFRILYRNRFIGYAKI